MRLGLLDGDGEVAVEGGFRQEAGLRIEQTARIDGAQRAAELRFEGMLTDQRQRIGGDARRFARYDLEIRQSRG